ncbi:MAG TPA: polysaccharide biosynthesis tyrosine autokinase, partial [Methylomirabilota bacterium]
SIGTIEDVESYLEVPVLGIVPHIDPRETMQRLIERRPALARIDPEALHSHALLITHFDPKSPVAEAYRTLRTNIQFARMERGGKVLVVTSPTLQEGKTTTIVNLALTMAQSGQKTLLVGGNMRRPSLHRFFGIDREPGLSDILVGNARWRDCIRTVADILMGRFEMEDIMAAPGLDNLHIIEAGPIPANPSELLSTSAMTDFLREVSAEYDIVLIDTPPVLPVTDSAIVAGQADGVLLVYQAGKVGRLVLKRAKAHLESTRAKVWGVVLNDVQTEVAGYNYTHYYTHYYGEETPSTREGGVLQRAWSGLRARLGRAPAAPATSAAPGAGDGAGLRVTELPRSSRRSRPRHLWLGLLVLGGLAALLGGLAVWQLGALQPGRTPLGQLRQRLGIGPATPASAPPAPVQPTPPAAPARASAPSGAVPSGPASPPVVAPAPSAAPVAGTPAPAAQFVVEFGPFPTATDAERAERQLTQAGVPTTRVREQTGAGLYAVLIERMPAGRDARTFAAVLREQGFADAAVIRRDPPAVRLGAPVALRGAVALAERARGLGHPVRVAAEPGEAIAYVIRHGRFASREEAETTAEELGRFGLSQQVIRVR